MGETNACDQREGKAPVFKLCLNKAAKIGASSTDNSLSMRQGIWSGPAALDGFRPDSSFSTPFWFIIRGSIVG